MNKIILALVSVAVLGVGIFLFRKYKKVKPVRGSYYVDVNGVTDTSRDANGNYLPEAKTTTESLAAVEKEAIGQAVLHPLSLSSSSKLVEGLQYNNSIL